MSLLLMLVLAAMLLLLLVVVLLVVPVCALQIASSTSCQQLRVVAPLRVHAAAIYQ
jgi:hypothetical protein